ncbi:HAMP domain-containing sensor histidine kinase [Ornithinibacillus sp. FSL M8-0202]|uniref:sensor histidine kinase n=1 Tax=unclassified Ornithinibacillus TaxID=2620869 RepID=UPI0030D001CC
MRNRIVVKLFLLTSGLCILILASIFIGQTILFEDYYANNKMNQLSQAVDSFIVDYQKLDEDEIRRQELEQQFYQENNAWIAVLDKHGYINGTKDYSVQLNQGFVLEDDMVTYTDQQVAIPIFYLEDTYNENDQLDFFEGKENRLIEIHGIEKDNEIYPYELILSTEEVVYEPENPFYLLNGGIENVSFWKNNALAAEAEKHKDSKKIVNQVIYGSIDDIHIPSNNSLLYASTLSNRLFLERIKQFQIDLIFNRTQVPLSDELEYEENGINYRVLINEQQDTNGETIYFFTMASLQPIDEAVEMMKDYYIYIILGVLVLILLVAFYYSKKIASPLLKINNTAKRIANLDFKERVPVKSKDEIGELAKNINSLSDTLHSYIRALQQDIEKERQLELTRKSFIAGVSHELKTPLSIMKSCIDILQDGVAKDKREYYFAAMSQEVNRMDRLIVDMLELAKFESGTYKMKMEVFRFDELIHNVYQQLLIKARDKDVHVNVNVEPIEVVANEHWIEQVVMNFVTNAIRHTPESGHITITTSEEDSKVKITIENEGSSIDPDQLEKVWDRFYQGDKNQRSKEGTGLGLAISKNILLLHDVEYGVYNTDTGVCFYFYLNKS